MFRAEIEATNLCNTRCLHCPHEAITRPKGRMSWETFARVADQIRAHAGGERFALSFSGMGEPLLNPEIFRFIRHVSDQAETSFASNGALLTEQNVERLIEAGLDAIYLSFNGDEPELFARMMGGLPLDRVWRNAERIVERTRGTRLKLRANISVTKANRHRLAQIRARLESAGIGPVAISLCHHRGGNLRDPEVCDTPAMGEERWTCDVLQNTLFVDWRGQAFICDHDIHGEYGLGDLMTEPLAAQECNDIMRVGNATPLASGAGGIFRDWVFQLYKDEAEPLAAASAPFKWIYHIYEKNQRVDRLVNRLLEIEQELQRELAVEREQKADLWRELDERGRIIRDLAAVEQRAQRDLAAANAEIVALRAEIARLGDAAARPPSPLVQAAQLAERTWTTWCARDTGRERETEQVI